MTDRRVGYGLTGMILRYSPEIVQKVPFGGDDQFVLDAIKHEMTVYERLGPHPRILKYLGPIGSGFLLEYHERGTLRQELELGTTIRPVEWAKQITEAVDYLHQNGIVHCDLNARNILITNNLDAVLADFGSSSIDGQQEFSGGYDPSCSRPNQDQYVPLDDIFALGSIFYEICTGSEPYAGKPEEEVSRLYSDNNFPSTSGLELGTIINKCWQAQYGNAREVLEDIWGLLPNLSSVNTSESKEGDQTPTNSWDWPDPDLWIFRYFRRA